VVRVCCRFHFVACCCFKKRPFVNFKRYLSPGRFFFCNLVISEIRSRRPNRECPFCFLFFFTNILLSRHSSRHLFLFNITSDYCIRDLCCLLIFEPFKVVLFYRYLTARLFSFISSLFNVAVCFCLCYPCLMLRFVLFI
jgi:hypothetical protein